MCDVLHALGVMFAVHDMWHHTALDKYCIGWDAFHKAQGGMLMRAAILVLLPAGSAVVHHAGAAE